jgi:CRP/FNR family transcriptional regulator, dissimilatory nitrate respiration regulator
MVRIGNISYSGGMEEWICTTLKRCPLFRGVDDEGWRRILAVINPQVQSYHQEARVAFRGDRYGSLWIIVSGYLTAELRDYSGKVLKVETMHAPQAIATAVLFAEENYLPVDLVAASDVEILSISRRKVLELFQKEQQVLLNYLSDCGDRLILLADKIRFIQFSTIREKIADYLLDLSVRQGTNSVELRTTKETLSEVFGVTRPSLSRGFSQLSEEGLIKQEGKVVHILDTAALERFMQEAKEGEMC